jgi:type II secretory pathway pseudopilin PulG
MTSVHKNKFAGFTLLELMIAMVVTMILLYSAVTVFRDASQSDQTVSEAADMTDNLRAGLNLIQQDLQQAGTGMPTAGIPIPFTSNGSATAPCGTTPAPVRPKLNGTTTFPPCNSVLPSIEPGQQLGPLISAPDAVTGNVSNPNSFTDEITMLYADNTSGLDQKTIYSPPVAANPPVPANPGCPNGSMKMTGTTLTATFDPTCVNLTAAGIVIQPGDLVMFSNTLGTAVLTVTAVAGNALTFASGDGFGLNGRNDASGTIYQLETGGSACGGGNACFPPTTASRIWMVSYFLDNTSSPPFVRLVRQLNLYAPTPVGETLENLQFTYNFVDGVSNPSNQPAIPAGNSESQIRSVNVYMGARSSYMIHRGAQMLYARNNLVTQVSLRSMAYYNKYQ